MTGFTLKPDFVAGAEGDLFVLDVLPDSQTVAQVLYLPPHGEELNRCRSMISAQARELARRGVATRILDYYGTGDSDGSFDQCSWDVWLNDLSQQLNGFTANRQIPVILAGFRLGALLALDFVNRQPALIEKLLLMQPVFQGKQYVAQLLRQRMAMQMSNELAVEATEQMRERLRNGEHLEIGGYQFGGEFLTTLDGIRLQDMTAIAGMEINWLEFVPASGKALTVGAQKAVNQLIAQGNQLVADTVKEAPVWQLHEREEMGDGVSVMASLELGL